MPFCDETLAVKTHVTKPAEIKRCTEKMCFIKENNIFTFSIDPAHFCQHLTSCS